MSNPAHTRKEIRITGFGGQGIVLAAHIIGRACAINAGNHATMIQSFGPEARGSTCSATLVIDERQILYPYIRRPDIFVVMSSEGYEKYIDELKQGGILIYEQDLVKQIGRDDGKSFGVPSTRIAESLGRVIVQNIVMVGFVTAVTRIAAVDAMRDAVLSSVPPGTEKLNLEAFEAGVRYHEDAISQPVAAEVMV